MWPKCLWFGRTECKYYFFYWRKDVELSEFNDDNWPIENDSDIIKSFFLLWIRFCALFTFHNWFPMSYESILFSDYIIFQWINQTRFIRELKKMFKKHCSQSKQTRCNQYYYLIVKSIYHISITLIHSY